MKKNDVVEYIGCSEEQIKWGSNDDPRSFLILGKEYTIEKVFVQSKHTKIKLYHKMGLFNSVCFKLKNRPLNNSLKYIKNMDPSSIKLESTVKLFEYEKLSREIESCNDLDDLKEMCRCFVKLHLKHQEVASKLGI
jgi:hypothetical protein